MSGAGLSFSGTVSLNSSRAWNDAVYNNGYVYTGGGFNGGYLSSVEYSAVNGNGTLAGWNLTTNLQNSRYGFAFEIMGGKVCAIG